MTYTLLLIHVDNTVKKYKHTLFEILFCTIFFSMQIANAFVAHPLWQQDDASNPKSKASYFVQKMEQSHGTKLHLLYTDSLLSLSVKHNLEDLYIISLVNKGIYYINVGKYEQGVTYYVKALGACEKLPKNDKSRIIVLANLGNTYNTIGEYKKSIETMQQVVELAKTHQDPERVLTASYNAMGTSYSYLNDHKKSIEFYMKVKDIGEKLGRNDVLATVLNNLANQYIKNCEIAKGKELAEKSLLHSKNPLRIFSKAWSHIILGDAYNKLNEPETSIVHLTKAKSLAEKHGLKKIIEDAHKLLAKSYELKGAKEKSNQEQKLYTEYKNTSLQESLKANIVTLKNETKEKDEKITSLERSISWLHKGKNSTIKLIFFLLVLLIAFLLFYLKKRNTFRQQTWQLQQDYKILSNELIDITSRMQELSIKKATAKDSKDNKEKSHSKYKNSSLSTKERTRLKESILDLMKKKEPYLDIDLKQKDLAQLLSISTHHLSEVLNLSFGHNFYNFINIYRVNKAKQLLKTTKSKDMKIITVAYDSGFSNKTSFNRIFKGHVGLTPSQYREKCIPANNC